MQRRFRKRFTLIVAAATAILMLLPATALSSPRTNHRALTVTNVEVLGEVIVPSFTAFGGTEIGGLSSITYDEGRGVYYALSDDQGNRTTGDPVRYYTIEIDLDGYSFDDADLEFVDVSTLFENKKTEYAPGGLDPEGLVLAREGQLYMSSEGNIFSDPILDPFIKRYNLQGRVTGELPIPDKYIPNGVDFGVRQNLGFESLNMTPSGRHLVTANEAALFQDGPAATATDGSLARILTYDIHKKSAISEVVYEVGPWAEDSPFFGVNGIVEVLPIDDVGTMLVMERSFSVAGSLGSGTGNYVEIFEVSTKGATNVLGVDALYEGGAPIGFTPVSKRSVFVFEDLGIPIDNIEGMTFGPTLDDGRQTLVIVSDDNFSAFGAQFTQFFVIAIDIETAG